MFSYIRRFIVGNPKRTDQRVPPHRRRRGPGQPKRPQRPQDAGMFCVNVMDMDAHRVYHQTREAALLGAQAARKTIPIDRGIYRQVSAVEARVPSEGLREAHSIGGQRILTEPGLSSGEAVLPAFEDREPPPVNYDRKPHIKKSARQHHRGREESSSTNSVSSRSQVSSTSCTTIDTSAPPLPDRPDHRALFRHQLEDGSSCARYSWKISENIRTRSQRLYDRLRKHAYRDKYFFGKAPVDSRGSFTYGAIDSKIFKEAGIAKQDLNAKKAWRLLHDKDSINWGNLSVSLFENFFLLFDTLKNGKDIPLQTPFHVRARYDKSTQSAVQLCQKTMAQTHTAELYEETIAQRHNLADSVLRLNDELRRARVFVSVLERMLEGRDFEGAELFVDEVLHRQGQIEYFRYVEMERLSNLLATLVRSFLPRFLRGSGDVRQAIVLFERAIVLSEKARDFLFTSVIAKLERYELPLCFGMFLCTMQNLKLASETQYLLELQELFRHFNAQYSILYPALNESFPDFMPACSVICFLDLASGMGNPFITPLHQCMGTILTEERWAHAWRDQGLEEKYGQQREIIQIEEKLHEMAIKEAYGKSDEDADEEAKEDSNEENEKFELGS